MNSELKVAKAELRVGNYYRLESNQVVKCIAEVAAAEGMGPLNLKFVLTTSPLEDGGFFVKADGTHPSSPKHSVKAEVKGDFTYDINVGDVVIYGNGMEGPITYKDEVGMVLKTEAMQEDGAIAPLLFILPPKQELFLLAKEESL